MRGTGIEDGLGAGLRVRPERLTWRGVSGGGDETGTGDDSFRRLAAGRVAFEGLGKAARDGGLIDDVEDGLTEIV